MAPQNNHFFSFRRLWTHVKNFKNDFFLTGIRSVHFRKAEFEHFIPESEISLFYFIYRIVYMLIFIFMLSYSLSCSSTGKYKLYYYFIFFTNWTMICCTIYAILFGCYAIFTRCRKRQEPVIPKARITIVENEATPSPSKTNRDESVSSILMSATSLTPRSSTLKLVPNSLSVLEMSIWLMQSISFSCSYIVTIGFWGLIYNPSKPFPKACDFTGQVIVHGANALFLTLDLMVCAVPVHITHVLYTYAYGVVYVVFSGLYNVLNAQYPDNEDGKRPYIYSFVNWHEHPLEIALVLPIVGFLALLVFQFLALLLYSLRLLIVFQFKPNAYDEHLYNVGYKKNNRRVTFATDENDNPLLRISSSIEKSQSGSVEVVPAQTSSDVV